MPDNEQRLLNYDSFTWVWDYFKTFRLELQNFPGMKNSWGICSHDLSFILVLSLRISVLECVHISRSIFTWLWNLFSRLIVMNLSTGRIFTEITRRMVKNAANNSEFIELQSFLIIIVKTIEFFWVVPWGKW